MKHYLLLLVLALGLLLSEGNRGLLSPLLQPGGNPLAQQDSCTTSGVAHLYYKLLTPLVVYHSPYTSTAYSNSALCQ